MKKTLILTLLFFLFTNIAVAQTITGKVTDEQNQPFQYVNILLQTADSTYLAGTITAEDGTFAIAAHPQGKLLSISFVGYKSVCKEIMAENMGTVQLFPDNLLLSEVVVKAELPKPEYRGDALVTTIQGTVLEKAGTAENLLDKIPNVTAQDGTIEVFGRGTPEIYINGRKMRDVSELDQLSSQNVKSVEVVSNPGARYNASVKSVIRIITKKITGEGFGINNRTVIRYREDYGMSYQDQIDLNYRKNGFELQGILFGARNKNGNDAITSVNTYLDKHWKQILDLTDQEYETKKLQATLSLNYQFNENHAAGARYSYDRTPDEDYYVNQFVDTYCNDKLYESLYSNVYIYNPVTYHRTNIYYSGRINKWSIDFNADGLWNDSYSAQDTQEQVTDGNSGNPDRKVTTVDTKKNDLYAAKFIASHPVAKGNLSFGAEYSYNNRNTTYFNEEGVLANDKAQIKEGAASAFVQYGRKFKKVNVQAGVRYENVDFDYYNAGRYVKEQSKIYNNVFPSITLSFPVKKVQMQLSYASDINRPSYGQLGTNTTYANRYTLEKGNPFLMPSVSNNLTFGASYKWINIYLAYSHVMDAITNQTVAYSDDDPTISLLTFLNAPAYDHIAASVNLGPKIGIWRPQLGLAVLKQWYWGETPDGRELIGKPVGNINFRNNFTLPANILLDVNASYLTKGNTENIYIEKGRFDINASLSKSFFKGAFTAQLNGYNLLQAKQKVTVYSGIRVIQNVQVSHRNIYLTLRYKFNSTKSKYKGTGAGESQKSRM